MWCCFLFSLFLLEHSHPDFKGVRSGSDREHDGGEVEYRWNQKQWPCSVCKFITFSFFSPFEILYASLIWECKKKKKQVKSALKSISLLLLTPLVGAVPSFGISVTIPTQNLDKKQKQSHRVHVLMLARYVDFWNLEGQGMVCMLSKKRTKWQLFLFVVRPWRRCSRLTRHWRAWTLSRTL